MEDYAADTPNPARAKLSDKWQRRFEILDRYATRDGNLFSDSKAEACRALTRKERTQVDLLFWPIIFGPFYYFAKGMWQKGAVFLGLAFLVGLILTLVEYGLDTTLPNVAYGLPIGFLCASMASYDYYKYVEYGEKMWPGMPGFLSHPIGAAAFPLVALFILMGTTSYTHPWYADEATDEMNDSVIQAVNGLWVDEDMDLVSVSLDREGGTLHTPVDLFMVSISEIAWGRDSVRVIMTADGEDAAWVLEQTYEAEGLYMELHDSARGVTTRLNFARQLEPF